MFHTNSEHDPMSDRLSNVQTPHDSKARASLFFESHMSAALSLQPIKLRDEKLVSRPQPPPQEMKGRYNLSRSQTADAKRDGPNKTRLQLCSCLGEGSQSFNFSYNHSFGYMSLGGILD